MALIYHGKKNNGTEVCLWQDHTAKLPFIVGYRFGNEGSYRTLLTCDSMKDAYSYYNELLA